MKKLFFILLLSGVLFAQENQPFIEVNGTSKILAEADYITFKINLHNVSQSLEASRKENLGASKKLVEVFNQFKIEKEDWEILPIQFGKEYNFEKGNRALIGYYSRQTITVKLRNLEDYYNFVSALSMNSMFEISDSQYGITNLLEYHKKATIKALKDAKAKAKYVAATMGVNVGKIMEIVELNENETFPDRLNSMAAIGVIHETMSGKVAITRSVKTKFKIDY